MLYATIVLFALAAVMGLLILKSWLTGEKISRTIIYAHGIFAALGLALLIVHYFQNGAKTLQAAIILFGRPCGFLHVFQGYERQDEPCLDGYRTWPGRSSRCGFNSFNDYLIV